MPDCALWIHQDTFFNYQDGYSRQRPQMWSEPSLMCSMQHLILASKGLLPEQGEF